MGATNDWEISRQMYILLGISTDLRDLVTISCRWANHVVWKPWWGVKTLVRCENPGEPAEPQGQLAGVKSEWSSRAGQYNADIIESAGGLAQSFSRVSCYISKINQIRLLIFGCETGLWISGNVIPLKIFIFCNIFWFTSAKTRKKAQAKQNSYRKREKKGNQSRESCDKHTL